MPFTSLQSDEAVGAGLQLGRDKSEPALISLHLLIYSHLMTPFKSFHGMQGACNGLCLTGWLQHPLGAILCLFSNSGALLLLGLLLFCLLFLDVKS